MREYGSNEIRNVAVVGHGASGKTSLVDALAFVSGSSKRHGAVKDGTALTDFSPDEIERGFSINLGCAHAEWMDTKINLIDTPGYQDFIGDAIAGLSVADGAMIVVSPTAGVEVGTEVMYRAAVERKTPVLFVVSMMDKEHASFRRAYEDIKARLTSGVVPVEVPIGEGQGFQGTVNLFSRRASIYKKGTKAGEYEEGDVPESERANVEKYYQQLIETIAATDDALLERYLEGGTISDAEAMAAMREGIKRGELVPLFCVAAQLSYGTRELLSRLIELMPAAYEMEELHGFTGNEGSSVVQIHATDQAPFTALVFKTYSEPHVGDVSFFRVFSGSAANGQDVFNATRGVAEKLGHLCVPQGRERIEVPKLRAGDIGCVAKLKNTHTNDSLSTREHPVRFPAVAFPEPLVTLAVHAADHGDEEKLQQGLHRIHEEDQTFQTHYNPETHETIVSGMGERHLEVAMARLQRKYGVRGDLGKPKIAYRETFTAKADGQGRHKKQTGGRGQFGDCWVRLGPQPRGAGYKFVDEIVGGVIPGKFVPAVDDGIQEAAARGILAGYPLVDFKAEVYDGSYHSVDSNEMSFKMAGIQAFKTVATKCRPVLLEPVDAIEVTTPNDYLGDVMGDLSGRRGQILGTDATDDRPYTKIRASVPQGELHLYATRLHSLTHGRGSFTRQFRGYEQMPADAAQRVVDDSAKHRQEAMAG